MGSKRKLLYPEKKTKRIKDKCKRDAINEENIAFLQKASKFNHINIVQRIDLIKDRDEPISKIIISPYQEQENLLLTKCNDDILLLILSHLETMKDILQWRLVCKRFYFLSQNRSLSSPVLCLEEELLFLQVLNGMSCGFMNKQQRIEKMNIHVSLFAPSPMLVRHMTVYLHSYLASSKHTSLEMYQWYEYHYPLSKKEFYMGDMKPFYSACDGGNLALAKYFKQKYDITFEWIKHFRLSCFIHAYKNAQYEIVQWLWDEYQLTLNSFNNRNVISIVFSANHIELVTWFIKVFSMTIREIYRFAKRSFMTLIYDNHWELVLWLEKEYHIMAKLDENEYLSFQHHILYYKDIDILRSFIQLSCFTRYFATHLNQEIVVTAYWHQYLPTIEFLYTLIPKEKFDFEFFTKCLNHIFMKVCDISTIEWLFTTFPQFEKEYDKTDAACHFLHVHRIEFVEWMIKRYPNDDLWKGYSQKDFSQAVGYADVQILEWIYANVPLSKKYARILHCQMFCKYARLGRIEDMIKMKKSKVLQPKHLFNTLDDQKNILNNALWSEKKEIILWVYEQYPVQCRNHVQTHAVSFFSFLGKKEQVSMCIFLKDTFQITRTHMENSIESLFEIGCDSYCFVYLSWIMNTFSLIPSREQILYLFLKMNEHYKFAAALWLYQTFSITKEEVYVYLDNLFESFERNFSFAMIGHVMNMLSISVQELSDIRPKSIITSGWRESNAIYNKIMDILYGDLVL